MNETEDMKILAIARYFGITERQTSRLIERFKIRPNRFGAYRREDFSEPLRWLRDDGSSEFRILPPVMSSNEIAEVLDIQQRSARGICLERLEMFVSADGEELYEMGPYQWKLLCMTRPEYRAHARLIESMTAR